MQLDDFYLIIIHLCALGYLFTYVFTLSWGYEYN